MCTLSSRALPWAGRALLLFSALGTQELMPSAAAQLGPLPWRVACGDNNGKPAGEAGWLLLSETSAPAGMTLNPPAVDTVHVAQTAPMGGVPMPSDVCVIDPDELPQAHRLTSLQLADGTELSVGGLPASKPLRLRLELGAAAPWWDVSTAGVKQGASTVSREVKVEERTPSTGNWRPLLRDLDCQTGTKGNSFSTTLSGIVPVWCLVHSDASGTLRLRFSTAGSDPVFLTGFELHAYEPLPVQYHHGATGPLQSSDPLLAGFVAAFNAHDYDGAQQVAQGLADPWRRGVALCHLVGWLDGSRDGRFGLIPSARAALLAAQGSHPGAAWLLSQLDQLQRALQHLAARGYAWAKACSEDGGYGYLNPDCAGQVKTAWGSSEANVNAFIALRLLSGLCAPATGATVLADVKTWNAGAGGSGSWEPSPFVFAALNEYGRTLAAINPMLAVQTSDPESVKFLQRFRDIFQHGFLAPAYDVGDFPKAVELLLFERYAELGQHPLQWTTEQLGAVLTPAQIESSWWGPLVAEQPAVPGAPPWATREREVLGALRQVADYWLTVRFQGQELGGGLGDDVELVAPFVGAWGGQQDQGSRRSLDALDAFARHAWETSGAVVDGYYAGAPADVEHSAEYSANVAIMLRGLFGHTRRSLREGLAIGSHLVSAEDPAAAWAANTALGRLHFRTEWFNTDGPVDDPATTADIPLNGRATIPAVAAASIAPLAASHPLLADLRRWADAWRDDALATGNGKPAGFLAPVQWPSNSFGSGSSWWSGSGSTSDDAIYSKGEVSYPLEVLRLAYRTSTASDRWRYLLPSLRLFRAAQQWEDKGQPAAAQGSQDWAAGLFRDCPRFHALVVSHLQDLATDPTLTSTDDPALAGSAPYVDAALIARLHAWAEQPGGQGGLNSALAYSLGPVHPCGNGQAKSLAMAQWGFDEAWPYLRAAFPLLTARVLHTDRVLLNRGQLVSQLLAAHSGCNVAEGLPQRPALHWVGRFGAPLELAVMVNGKSWDESWISAFVYSFNSAPTALDLWLDEGLRPGNYSIDVGPPGQKCDTYAVGQALSTSWVDKRGVSARAPLVLPPGLSLVRVARQGPPSSAAKPWDLALDPPELELSKQGSSSTLVVRARLTNVGSMASPAGTLSFRAALVLPDGTPMGLFPSEASIGTVVVPSLPACNGWQSGEATLELSFPVTPSLSAVLVSGLAIQVRAETAAFADDSNPLNNVATRAWLPEEIPMVN